MATKLYDLCVSTGKYINAEGKEKNRYLNVGAILESDNGRFIMLEKHFNPAGINPGDGRSSIILSMFKPKQQQAAPAPAQEENQHDYDDDIPF